MRTLQIGILMLGVAAFLAAAVTAGGDIGDICWRVGVACMATDVVIILLWPSPRGDVDHCNLVGRRKRNVGFRVVGKGNACGFVEPSRLLSQIDVLNRGHNRQVRRALRVIVDLLIEEMTIEL